MAAIRSLYRFASYLEPGHAALIQRVLAIPDKRTRRTIVTYLNAPEIDALLNAVNRGTWLGRRDHALLLTAIQTGLRVSELCGLRRCDLTLTNGPHVRCQGKGRKDRCTPLTRTTVAALKTWLAETANGDTDPVFPTRTGGALKPDSIGDLLDRYRHRPPEMPGLDHRTRDPPHPAPQRRHATPPRRRRHVHRRVMARPRTGRDYRSLPGFDH